MSDKITCSACGIEAETDADYRWLRIAADGSVIRPTAPHAPKHVHYDALPPADHNAVVCSEACLVELAKTRA